MKIKVEEAGYVFSREWEEDESNTRPTVDVAVDAALYLLSRFYYPEEVEQFARSWEM